VGLTTEARREKVNESGFIIANFMDVIIKLMNNLSSQKCVPCEGGVKPFGDKEITEHLKQISPNWKVLDGKKIQAKFKFKNFLGALNFVNKVGDIAEGEGHHPDIEFGWGYANITLSTHAIGGLSKNDFILAAKIDLLL